MLIESSPYSNTAPRLLPFQSLLWLRNRVSCCRAGIYKGLSESTLTCANSVLLLDPYVQ